ncbi:MAG: histidine--tRNA ligase [Deltaproteobacteria bacterium]|nr:histidine--tRNA ligase [Deltaproteobacteria bacterium]
MTKLNTQPPRGTRDFYPEDLRVRQWLFAHWREVARRFGFEEVDAPIVEHAELYMRKAGEEIVDQLYHFELHDRHLALRSEFTPSLARMVMARQGALRWPIRWFGIPQCWRYERMTRGRRREHYQWNMDIWGEPGVTAEAELIAAAFAACDAFGLGAGDVRMRINSRALLEETLRERFLAERPEAFAPLCVIIDKLEKIGADAVVDQLAEPGGPVGLARPDAREAVELLSVDSLEDAARGAPRGSAALADLERLFELLGAYGLADRVVFDASVVRGLAYYTGIVFEAYDAGGSLRALCGGGRYDRLLDSLGGKPVPAAGFGFGDAVVTELLAEKGLLPELPRAVDAVVFPFGEDEREAATKLASALRRRGESVELVLASVKLKRALADADRGGARRVYLLGPDECARNVARVRDLISGEERDEPLP